MRIYVYMNMSLAIYADTLEIEDGRAHPSAEYGNLDCGAIMSSHKAGAYMAEILATWLRTSNMCTTGWGLTTNKDFSTISVISKSNTEYNRPTEKSIAIAIAIAKLSLRKRVVARTKFKVVACPYPRPIHQRRPRI